MLQLLNSAFVLKSFNDCDKKITLTNKKLSIANLVLISMLIFFMSPLIIIPPNFILFLLFLAPYIIYDLLIIDYYNNNKYIDNMLRKFSIAIIVLSFLTPMIKFN